MTAMQRVWACAWIGVVVCVAALGQAVNGSLVGVITDGTGAVVQNAEVVIRQESTGLTRTVNSNETGNYSLPNLPPGSYAIQVQAGGFKRWTRSGVTVQVNTSVRVDAVLNPGDVHEVVEVTTEAPVLQTERADTSAQVETKLMANLPLGVNRNFQSLINLVPGTTRAYSTGSQFYNAQNALQSQVNGQPHQGNTLQVEGIDDNHRSGNLQIMVPPVEALQVMDVSTSNYEAELGRASGAVTNVMLKSGGNQYHGAAYEFIRNSEMNARNFFDSSVGHQSYNYFGGNFGGPIVRNRLFFFADYLKVFDHQANANTMTIPTSDFRTGDFRSSSSVIYNPKTGNPDGTGRIPYAGNIIPASDINPIATKIMAMVPQPNQPGTSNNYFALLPFHKDVDSFDVKTDYNASDRDRLSARLSFQRPTVFQAPVFGMAGGPAQKGFAGTGIQNTYSSGINYNRVLSPTLVSEFRIGVAYYHNDAQTYDYGTNSTEQLGIPGVNLDQYSSGMVSIKLNNGFSGPMVGYSSSIPWKRAETNVDIVNTWTKMLGNHSIKWGGDARRIRDDLLQMQTYSPRGIYSFGDGQTSIPSAKTSFANNMASFLLGLPAQVGRDLATYFPATRLWQIFGFVQDRWVATPKLTVNIGLRYELYPPSTPRYPGGFSNYDFTNNTLVVAGIGSNPMNMGVKFRKNYWSPRLGLAYRVRPSTVVRAGFGISYTNYGGADAYNYPVIGNNVYNPAVSGYGPALLPDGRVATFQAGMPAPIAAPIPANGIITNPDVNASYVVVNTNNKNPHVLSWNFSMQQTLPAKFVLDAAYVGNHGVSMASEYNLNASQTLGTGTAGQPQIGIGRTADTILYYPGVSSHYHALQVKLNRRFSGGMLLTSAYTWGKAMGFAQSDIGGIMYYINFQRNYARTDFDRQHTFVQSLLYELPFGKGKRWMNNGVVSKVVGGWQVNGILSAMTGYPINLSYSSSSLKTPGNSQSPNQIAPVEILHGIGTNALWFSTSSFAAPAAATFGNVGRNSMSGPGLFNLDASLFRIVQLTERFNLEVRGESIGITNTPQFGSPGTTLGSSSFGYVTSATGGRTLQLGLKLNF